MSQFPFKTKQASRVTPAKKYDENKRTIRLGTVKNPLVVTVQTQERCDEVKALCKEKQWICDISINEDKPEDISQLEALENKPLSVAIKKKPGRNDPCACGSGKKYKKCCGQ